MRTTDLQRANRTLLMVSACDQALVQISDEQELTGVICQIIQDEGGYPLAWVGLVENGERETIRTVASAGDSDGYLESLRRAGGEAAMSSGAGRAVHMKSTGCESRYFVQRRERDMDKVTLSRGIPGGSGVSPPRSAEERHRSTCHLFGERRRLRAEAGHPPQGARRRPCVRDYLPPCPRGAGPGPEGPRAEGVAAAGACRGKSSARSRGRGRGSHSSSTTRSSSSSSPPSTGSKVSSSRGRRRAPAECRDAERPLAGMHRHVPVPRRPSSSHPSFTEPDLCTALGWLGAWMKEKHGLDVTVDRIEAVTAGVEETRVTLLQSVRELLFNVVKHAGVKESRLVLAPAPDGCVQVTVSDRGVGFEPDLSRAPGPAAGGIGLFSMRERLDVIGGGMRIESAPGRGSRVAVWVPADPSPDVAAPRPGANLGGTPDAGPGGSAGKRPARAPRRLRAPRSFAGKIRVLLVDDHAVVRNGIALQLLQQPDIEIVGEAADGATAVELVRTLRPDVVTMDVNIPGMNGIDAARAIHSECPGRGSSACRCRRNPSRAPQCGARGR